MKTRLLRELRRMACKRIKIKEPKRPWEPYYIKNGKSREDIHFYRSCDFDEAEKRVRELRRYFIEDILHEYKKGKERARALKRINQTAF